MTRNERRLLHVATWAVGGTGLVYLVFRYAWTSSDPYAIINHPWQPYVQHWHVLTAPLLVFAFALIWRGHAEPYRRAAQHSGRRTGLLLLLLFVPMVLSGYALQVTVDDDVRRVWSWTHIAASGGWLVGYGAHLLSRKFPLR